MSTYPFEVDEDGVPWASPEIQAAYEAALGRFMLAFNRLDNQLTEVLRLVLHKAGRTDLFASCTDRDFWLKLLALDLLKLSAQGAGISAVSVPLLRHVAAHRNKVAHGHFDQNPHSGEYDIVGKGKRVTYSAEDLDRHAAKATEAWSELRSAEGYYVFDDVPLSPAP